MNILIEWSFKLVRYVLKMVSFGSKEFTKELYLECAYFLGQQASLDHLGLIRDNKGCC